MSGFGDDVRDVRVRGAMHPPPSAFFLWLALGAAWSCAGDGEGPREEAGAGAVDDSRGEGSGVPGEGGSSGELGGGQGDPDGDGAPLRSPPRTLRRRLCTG